MSPMTQFLDDGSDSFWPEAQSVSGFFRMRSWNVLLGACSGQ